MTDFGRRTGIGDMLKSTYDPNEDGVIALAQTEANITATGVAILIGIHAAIANVHHTPPTADPGEGAVFLDPGSYHEVIQGTFILVAAGDSYHIGGVYNTSLTNQDAISWKAYLAAGTYTLVHISPKSTNYAILDISVDGTGVASFDLYNASPITRAINKQTGIVIASSGIKTIQCIADGKNPSSSSHAILMESVVFYRTA